MLKKRLMATAMVATMVLGNPIHALANDTMPEAVPRIADEMLESAVLESYNVMEQKIWTLAQLIEAEAGNQDLQGKMFVGDVVVNRTRSPRYPNTIEEVIYQRGQFQVVRNGKFDQAKNCITMESVVAAILALNGEGDQGILYFGTGRRNGRGHWKYGSHWFSY